MDAPTRSSAGFSTVEVMVASFLLLTLAATMFGSYRYNLFAIKRQEAQLDVQETARSLIDVVAREVRQAGYDPTCVKTFEGIAEGRAVLLRFQFDRNGDGIISSDENITYSYAAETDDVGRSVGSGTRTALVRDLPVQALTFDYFDGAGAALLPAGLGVSLNAAQRAAVRRVRITVHIERPLPRPLGDAPVVSEMVTNVDLRNRYFNSGVGCP